MKKVKIFTMLLTAILGLKFSAFAMYKINFLNKNTIKYEKNVKNAYGVQDINANYYIPSMTELQKEINKVLLKMSINLQNLFEKPEKIFYNREKILLTCRIMAICTQKAILYVQEIIKKTNYAYRNSSYILENLKIIHDIIKNLNFRFISEFDDIAEMCSISEFFYDIDKKGGTNYLQKLKKYYNVEDFNRYLDLYKKYAQKKYSLEEDFIKYVEFFKYNTNKITAAILDTIDLINGFDQKND